MKHDCLLNKIIIIHLYRSSISANFKKNQNTNWLRGLDLNQGPSGYEPDELPDCSTPRYT